MAMSVSNSVSGETFDITGFLWHFKCLVVLIQPVVKFSKCVLSIVRWKSIKKTIITWLIINLLTALIPSAYTLVVLLAAMCIFALLGVLHHHTGIFLKLFPDRELETNALQTYIHHSWADEQNILREYRSVLWSLSRWFLQVNTKLQGIYKIIKWDRPCNSACYTVCVAVFTVSLFLLDLRWNILLLNNTIILGNGLILWRKKRKIHPAVDSSLPDEAKLKMKDDVDIGNQEHKSCGEESDIESDAALDGEENVPIDDTVQKTTEEYPDGKRRNVVKKIMDLRKRRQQHSQDVCTGCQDSFTSILKRKCYCNNCGNYFCSRCCSTKVTKSFLGVTAPETRNDIVTICYICHRQLTARTVP